MSKHDDRRKVEAGPSLSSVVPRSSADKLGPSDRLDLVSIGAAGKVDFVRVTQAMYQDVPPDGTSLWHRITAGVLINVGGSTINTISQYTIPDNQVLDLCSVRFFAIQFPGALMWTPMPDYALAFSKDFSINIDGTSPIDVTSDGIGGINPYSGSYILNEDWCTWWGVVPWHVIVRPRQTVSFVYFDRAICAGAAGAAIGVRVSGRWIPQPLFDKVVASNRIS